MPGCWLKRQPDSSMASVTTTGTPPGVGSGQKPPVFLQKGDVITLAIEGLGEQRQLVVPFKR